MPHNPVIVPKSWGHEVVIDNNPDYCGKILVFKAGGQTSMHYHIKKQETMYLLKGKILIRMENSAVGLDVGEYLRIERGQKHQIIAIEDSELMEVSTQHFEDDSVKIA